METEGSLPHSRAPATCLYPEPDQPSRCNTTHFLKIQLNIIIPSTPRSISCLFPPGFPTKILYAPLLFPTRTTRPAHLTLLDFITRIISLRTPSQDTKSSTIMNCTSSDPLTSTLTVIQLTFHSKYEYLWHCFLTMVCIQYAKIYKVSSHKPSSTWFVSR
jgi:hypothetical protein